MKSVRKNQHHQQLEQRQSATSIIFSWQQINICCTRDAAVSLRESTHTHTHNRSIVRIHRGTNNNETKTKTKTLHRKQEYADCRCTGVQYIKSRMLLISILFFSVFGVDAWQKLCIACNFVCKVNKTMETRKKKDIQTKCTMYDCMSGVCSTIFIIIIVCIALIGDGVVTRSDPNFQLNIRRKFNLSFAIHCRRQFNAHCLKSSLNGMNIEQAASIMYSKHGKTCTRAIG